MSIKWKKDYGDGYETDDSVLWIDGNPTENIVSPCSGYFTAYVNGNEEYISDTRTDAKNYVLDALGYR